MPFKMKLLKFSSFTLYPLLLLTLLNCNQTPKQSDSSKVDTTKEATARLTPVDKTMDSSINENAIEEKIIDTIFKLKEVMERAKYI
jgi:hypothetical protein